MMIMGNKKTTADHNRIMLIEHELGEECFKEIFTDEGMREVYLQVECTGLNQRTFGPFLDKDAARLWWDHVLNEVLDLLDQDDKRVFLGKEPLVQKWLQQEDGVGLDEDRCAEHPASSENDVAINLALRLESDDLEQMRQIVKNPSMEDMMKQVEDELCKRILARIEAMIAEKVASTSGTSPAKRKR